MNKTSKLLLISILGLAIFIVLFRITCSYENKPKPLTEGEKRWQARQREYTVKDSLRRIKDQEEEAAKELAEKESKRKIKAWQMGLKLEDIAKNYYWDCTYTEFSEQGAVVLCREVAGEDSERYSFHISSVDFEIRSGKTIAKCGGCIRYILTPQFLSEEKVQKDVSSVVISSGSQYIIDELNEYKEAVKGNMGN